MKTKNTKFKSAVISLQLLFFCFIFFQTANAQKGDLVLNFSGKDAVTSNIVPLESVKVSNETQGGDTTLYGAVPTLSLQWASGIFEQNRGQKASFILEPNYPNPFTESTTVNIRLRKPQRLIITLHDQQGAATTNLEQDFGFGTHHLEISVPQNRLCLLTVNDGVTTKTLKMFSTNGKDFRIKYLGTGENTGYKSETETAAFVFQPGDVLKYTVNAAGYYEYITYDNPVASMNYVFSLQPNTTELPPTVTTSAVTNITATTANCGGNVTSEGSAAVTSRGVCWNTAPGATIANSFTADGLGVGSFTSTITGLTESTNYYVRAYATNQFGTAYGNEMSFISTQALPTVTTAIATNITSTSATSGGNVTYEGSNVVTVRGICWSTSQNPTIANSFTADGSGLGSFTSVITGLTENTTYYVRAYAINQFGTAYGNEVSFTTAIQELVFYCDSAITYTSMPGAFDHKKIKFAYDANGNKLLELKQTWNSSYGIWVNSYQELYTYDASGNMLSRIWQGWNSNGNWMNDFLTLYSYDESGNMLSELYQYWNTNTGSWVNSSQVLYTYDGSGNMLSDISQSWDTNIGSWVYQWKHLFNYDVLGNKISYIEQSWDTNIGSWLNLSKYLYTYDASGNMLSEIYQYWNTDIISWENLSKHLYTYDASGNMLSDIYQNWNTNIGSWVYYGQYLYTYDASGNMLSTICQTWFTNFGSWVNNYQYLYTYDASGNLLSELYQGWNFNIGSWVNSQLGIFTYDASSNALSALYQSWNMNYGTWVNDNKYEYQYDYTTKKNIAMHFVWSGAWTPSDLSSFEIYMWDNYLFSGYNCYKLEVWYNSYPSGNKASVKAVSKVSDLIGIPKSSNGTISVSNPSEKEASIEYEFGSPKHSKEAWLNKNENRMPSQNLPQRNMSVGKPTWELNHSK